MYDFCSEDLKNQLAGPREAVKAEEDRKANQDRAAKKAKMVQPPSVLSENFFTCVIVPDKPCDVHIALP